MPSDAPEGLCPQCLMKGALGAGEESSLLATEIENQKSKIANSTASPTPAEIAPHFYGGFAEYYVPPKRQLMLRVPDALSDEVACGTNCALAQVIYEHLHPGAG